MEKDNSYHRDSQRFDLEEFRSVLHEVQKIIGTFSVPYPRPEKWEYLYHPSNPDFYSHSLNSWDYKASQKFTSQPEDEGMSGDDLKESQKMLFDFLGVSE